MYEFIDVTEVSEGTSLPSEALSFNGEFIENLIPGYRTLTVEGREALSPELTTIETGIRDGSTKKGKRYPARTIRITYQLIAASNEDFRAAFNKLAGILDVEDAQLIFNDEDDKYYTGTVSRIGEVPPGRNSVVGEFEILCLDPFKYSIMKYEAKPSVDTSSILIDYGGTYKSYPKLCAEFFKEDGATEDGEAENDLTGAGDCGYVAFFNENEKIIQLGDPEESDTADLHAKSQTLINNTFDKNTSWGTAAKNQWSVNAGITSSSAVEQAGNVGMAVRSYKEVEEPKSGPIALLDASSYAEDPTVHYSIVGTLVKRTDTTAEISVSIASKLGDKKSYFGNGFILSAEIVLNGVSKTVRLKDSSDYWEGKTEHKTSVTFKLTGLTSAAKDITGTFRAFRSDSTGGKTGVLAATAFRRSFTVPAYPSPVPDLYYLTVTNYGSGDNWHGPSITRTIPADETGEIGATNFTFSYNHRLAIADSSGAGNQQGAFQVLLVSGSGNSRKIVAGVNIYKGSSGKNANLRFYVGGEAKDTITLDLSYKKAYRTCTISKSGSNVQFNIAGIKRSYFIENSDIAVNQVTFTFTKFGDRTPLEYNALNWVKFVKDNCQTWRDIPNKFSANDVIEADCNSGEITLNDVSAPAYGALGNDWEEFYLTPGVNQIGFSYSDWVDSEHAPAFKVKYREVFL